MNVLYLFYMGVNWPVFNISNLDELGVSNISLFNNDLGYKIFKYDPEPIILNFNFEYMMIASWLEEWTITIKLYRKVDPVS